QGGVQQPLLHRHGPGFGIIGGVGAGFGLGGGHGVRIKPRADLSQRLDSESRLVYRHAPTRGSLAAGRWISCSPVPPPDLRRARRATKGETTLVQIFVRDNNVDQALKALKKKMQR